MNADRSSRSRRVRRGHSKASVSHIVGEILLTIGVLILLFSFYEAYWTNIASGKKQDAANSRLDQAWENPRQKKHPDLGDAFARMYIPAFGSDYHFAILEGTDDDTLLAGPGRYVDTQLPGEPGNFAVAGHRVGKGAPFNDLGNLQTCDAIVVETRSAWDVYRVLPIDGSVPPADCFPAEKLQRIEAGDYLSVAGRSITTPEDTTVLQPIPGVFAGDPAEVSAEPIMTLTTCHPQFSNAERMIIHAMSVAHYDKSEGFIPPELEEH